MKWVSLQVLPSLPLSQTSPFSHFIWLHQLPTWSFLAETTLYNIYCLVWRINSCFLKDHPIGRGHFVRFLSYIIWWQTVPLAVRSWEGQSRYSRSVHPTGECTSTWATGSTSPVTGPSSQSPALSTSRTITTLSRNRQSTQCLSSVGYLGPTTWTDNHQMFRDVTHLHISLALSAVGQSSL